MTQEEILDYNKRCAEFLGWKNLNDDSFPEYVDKLGNFYPLIKLTFHSDWNWIMEVLNKIKPLVCEAEFTNRVGLHLRELQKEKVIEGINQFLIWYNNENNKR